MLRYNRQERGPDDANDGWVNAALGSIQHEIACLFFGAGGGRRGRKFNSDSISFNNEFEHSQFNA